MDKTTRHLPLNCTCEADMLSVALVRRPFIARNASRFLCPTGTECAFYL